MHTIRALQCLKPSGDKSFERLVAELLGLLTGQPFRLCAAGTQSGADGLSDRGIAVQAKRYDEAAVTGAALASDLHRAIQSYPDLDVWVLASTQEVPAQAHHEIQQIAEAQGLSLLFLDAATTHRFSRSTPAIAALCAIQPDRLLEIIQDEEWTDPRKRGKIPQLHDLEDELHSIASEPAFDRWTNQMREATRALPTWHRLRERLNDGLLKVIHSRAGLLFGTHFDSHLVVQRTVREQVDEWFGQALASYPQGQKTAMLTGERYDGKTWVVFDWLLNALPGIPMPAFFISANQGDVNGKDIFELIREQIAECLGIAKDRADSLLRRFTLTANETAWPWGLVILDGLDEYLVDRRAPERHLTVLSAELAYSERRPALVLATIRTSSWDELPGRLRSDVRRISVGAFDSREISEALGLMQVPLNDFQQLTPSAQCLVAHPRFFALWAIHRSEFGGKLPVTPDALLYLDARDKARRRGHLGDAGWDHRAFSDFLKDLARAVHKQTLEGRPLQRPDLKAILDRLTERWLPALRDLESEEVLRENDGAYEVARDRLSLGMGLWLSEEVRGAVLSGKRGREVLRDLLEPESESSEKIGWVRSAAVVELIKRARGNENSAVSEIFLEQWLRTRHLSYEDLEQVKSLSALILPMLLNLASRSWSRSTGSNRLQEISLICFGEVACHAENDANRRLLESEARRWIRTLPARGARFLKAEDPRRVIRERLAEGEIPKLGLVTDEADSYLSLHEVALYLESLAGGLLRPEDVLCRIAIEHVADSPIDDGEFFVIQRVLENVAIDWFQAQVRQHRSVTGLWRRVLHRLISIAERADLQELEEELRSSEDDSWPIEWRALYPLDRGKYLNTIAGPPDEQVKPWHFVRRSRSLVRDPELPRPSTEWVEMIRGAVIGELRAKPLQLHRSSTSEDHNFEDAMPVLAAWLPGTAAEIVEGQMRDLPRRFSTSTQDDGTWWALSIGRHAVLARGGIRQALAGILGVAPDDQQTAFHAAEVFQALVPGMRPALAVETLLRHSFPAEWSNLYRVFAAVADHRMRAEIALQLQTEVHPVRLKRLRLLAYEIGGIDIPEAAKRQIRRDLASSDPEERFAALALAVDGGVRALPSRQLLEIVRNEDIRSSLAPRYAAWLLSQRREFFDQLPVVWQAVVAARFPKRRAGILDRMEEALLDSLGAEGWEGEPCTADLVEDVRVRMTGESNDAWHRISVAPEQSGIIFFSGEPRGVGGMQESEDVDVSPTRWADALNPDAGIAKRNHLAKEAGAQATVHAGDYRTAWREEVFPQQLVDALPLARFERWCRLLLANNRKATVWWCGLLQPLFWRALVGGNPIARELWSMVEPFNRPASPEVRFTWDGIDWVLQALAEPTMNDSVASELLERLVLECRSDLELFEVVLGSRVRDPARLSRLVARLLTREEAETRQRAVRLAGWLGGFAEELRRASVSDPSLAVQRIAADSLQEQDEEIWAKHWFAAFLADGSPEERWSAGQLFLACADRRVEVWAQAQVQSATSSRRRGEAHLLLEAVRSEAGEKERRLRDRFLGLKLRELAEVCYPWQARRVWSSSLLR